MVVLGWATFCVSFFLQELAMKATLKSPQGRVTWKFGWWYTGNPESTVSRKVFVHHYIGKVLQTADWLYKPEARTLWNSLVEKGYEVHTEVLSIPQVLNKEPVIHTRRSDQDMAKARPYYDLACSKGLRIPTAWRYAFSKIDGVSFDGDRVGCPELTLS